MRFKTEVLNKKKIKSKKLKNKRVGLVDYTSFWQHDQVVRQGSKSTIRQLYKIQKKTKNKKLIGHQVLLLQATFFNIIRG